MSQLPTSNSHGSNASSSMRELIRLRKALFAQVSAPHELPEVAQVLDVESRKGSTDRLVRHFHQMCLGHQMNYASSNRVRHISLIDAFLAMTRARNQMGLYAIARSMLELNALMREVQVRLQDAVLDSDSQNWQPLADSFFATLIRARFATTNPVFRELLMNEGVPAGRLKPFNVMDCLRGLAEDPVHQDALERYAVLCDYVHHNLGSGSTAASGSGQRDAARSAGGGAFVHPSGRMMITRYEYPIAPAKFENALEHVVADFYRDALSCIQWLNLTPETPFSPEFLKKMTGDELGVQVLREPRPR